jgi:glycerophosphoryl diester phosphodiesterase
VVRQILVYDGVDSIEEWHRVAPELPLIVSPPDEVKTPNQLVDFARNKGIEVLDSDWQNYSRAAVEAGNRAGIGIWPDIQASKEDPAFFESVLARGFTGAQTDHPEEFIAWLKSRNLR